MRTPEVGTHVGKREAISKIPSWTQSQNCVLSQRRSPCSRLVNLEFRSMNLKGLYILSMKKDSKSVILKVTNY